MSESRLFPQLLALFCVFNVSSVTNAMKSTISLTSSNSSFPGLRGSTATFFCGWSYDSDEEHVVGLRFTSIKRPQIYYYHIAGLSNMGIKKEYGYDDNRMSTSIVNIVNVTLTLSPLDCVDDDTYRCTVSYLLSGVEQPDEVSETVLTLQVPPSPPVITVLSGDLRDELIELELLVVKCEAIVGSSGKGKLHWRIYRGHGTEDVAPTDQRVNTSTADNLSCWDQITSELTTRVTRDDQDMVVTCFVTNDDFAPAASQPVACEDNTLCDQTQKIHIMTPDQTVILNPSPLTPDGFVTPGRPLVIHCNADIVGLDPQFVTIVRLVISRQLRGASTMQNVAVFSPYAQFIPLKHAIDNPSHRDWEVSYSDAPPLSLGVNSRNLTMIWTLNDARATDMGIYQCTVDYVKKDMEVSFVGQQRITERDTLDLILTQHPPRSQALREGDDLELICSARGVYDPISMILIRERTSELLESDLTTELTHTLKDLSCLDTGVYVCRGQSSQNKTERAISVHVYCPPRFIPSFEPLSVVDAAIGETVHLDLEIYGFPEPKALALHTVNDGEDLQTHPRFLLQYTEGEAPFGFVNLTISSIVKEDFTNYTLTVNNGEGGALAYTFCLNQVHGTTDKGHNLDSLSIIIGIIVVVIITGLGITILFLLTTNGNLKRKLDSRATTEGKVIVHPMELFPVTDTEPSPDSLSQPELYETIRDVIPASAQDPDTHDSDNYEVPVVNTDSRLKSGIRFNNPTYS